MNGLRTYIKKLICWKCRHYTTFSHKCVFDPSPREEDNTCKLFELDSGGYV